MGPKWETGRVLDGRSGCASLPERIAFAAASGDSITGHQGSHTEGLSLLVLKQMPITGMRQFLWCPDDSDGPVAMRNDTNDLKEWDFQQW